MRCVGRAWKAGTRDDERMVYLSYSAQVCMGKLAIFSKSGNLLGVHC
jgi:hypothetical protein